MLNPNLKTKRIKKIAPIHIIILCILAIFSFGIPNFGVLPTAVAIPPSAQKVTKDKKRAVTLAKLEKKLRKQLKKLKRKEKLLRAKAQKAAKKAKEESLKLAQFSPRKNHLTPSMGIDHYKGHKESYYNMNMAGLMRPYGGYKVRSDGVKTDKAGYVIVAANLAHHPRRSIVDTSLGLGKVYDTGGFASANPEQYDIATTW